MASDGRKDWRTEGWTDGRTDGHGQTYIPPPLAGDKKSNRSHNRSYLSTKQVIDFKKKHPACRMEAYILFTKRRGYYALKNGRIYSTWYPYERWVSIGYTSLRYFHKSSESLSCPVICLQFVSDMRSGLKCAKFEQKFFQILHQSCILNAFSSFVH